MRKVNVFKQVKEEGKWIKVLDFTGLFHQWGQVYEEFEAGPGNTTIAIVEKDDGNIVTINAELIQFQKPLEEVTVPQVGDIIAWRRRGEWYRVDTITNRAYLETIMTRSENWSIIKGEKAT